MAEHWMYMPLAGFLWALGEAVWLLGAHRPAVLRVAGVLAYAAFVVFIGLSLDRNRDWHDNESIYEATLRGNPNTARVHYNLAVTYDEVEADNPAGARRHYEHFLQLIGGDEATGMGEQELEARLSLGDIYLSQGRVFNAQNQYSEALNESTTDALAPYGAMAAYGLGRIALIEGDVQGAYNLFRQALQVRPELGAEVSRLLQSASLMGGA